MPCGDPDGAAEHQQTGTRFTQPDPSQLPVVPAQDPSAQNYGDDELDKDSGSKSESEQDEECTGSMGSAAVALDPIEKEWIYSAAGARVPDLSHLLRQDPSLANKKDFTSGTALHWAAKHGNEDMATLVANAGADVNTKSHVSIHLFNRKVMSMNSKLFDLNLKQKGHQDGCRFLLLCPSVT
uniref:Ankyrin repeat domain-containing protein SOWAHC-like n=1 Tax=Gasterosteus aculeatus aculeatus TaxID=481459 RepID=A0AAQ4QHN1_GASAC